ncbi:MAG: DUF2889 domain-containing protein [Acidiferrobacterales bacterium]|nr:DUF2889 domain-containing protein [Acidiferrobacterales bacterium]
MPLPESPNRSPLHTREVRCLGFQNERGLWEIEAHLLDTKPIWFPNHEKDGIEPGEPVHRMSLRLTLDLNFLIHQVDVAMDDTPYQLCRDVEQEFSKLEGIQIGAGWLREVRQRMPRTMSCTHLYELLTPIATTAYQSMHLALEERAEQLPARGKPPIVDQCYSLSSQSDVVKVKWPEFHQPKSN